MDRKEVIPEPLITANLIKNFEKIMDLSFTKAERKLMLKKLDQQRSDISNIRNVKLSHCVPPSLVFNPAPFETVYSHEGVNSDRKLKISKMQRISAPSNLEDVAFYPVTHLSQLIRTQEIESTQLTRMYLDRLKRYNPILRCVITLTEERAILQAKKADEDIASGHYRGPLHGIPWGVKDILATRGTRTTWGASPFKDQIIDTNGTVLDRLEAAGAVLVAKLSLGALAYGDVWFDGQTKNPWNIEEGSRGSSAGSAASVAAGLVAFAIGTETYGSIIAPCTRCGVTGFRPTFGRVSRYGAMPLSWSLDKIGPICRSVEDCAIVFNAIYGPDENDAATLVDYPFTWNPSKSIRELRLGYVKNAVKATNTQNINDSSYFYDVEQDVGEYGIQTLSVLQSLGFNLTPITLPSFPIKSIEWIIELTEAAASFDELTRSNKDDLLVKQDEEAWPNLFRAARLIPAVEYIQANRIRTLIMKAMATVFDNIDVYIAPSMGYNLILTNLTGHPAVVVPNGFSTDGKPCSSITFIGKLYGEADLLRVVKAYQDSTDFHQRHPEMNY
ncbi:MAG: amidase [Candidatus Bathyarchaeota archaeon]|nr:MAG: amidase [Candidatus Bathyarchaeota archaeon]